MYVYICIYAFVCVGDCSLCMMDSRGYMSNPLWLWVLWTLWHEYVLKAFVVGAYSCYTVCMVTAVWLSRSMSPSDIGFSVYASCINVFNTLRGFGRLVLAWACWHTSYTQALNPTSAPNAKLYWIFSVKIGIPIVVFPRQNFGENSVLYAMTHLRRSAARFLPQK